MVLGVIVMQMWCFAHAPRIWTIPVVKEFLGSIPAEKLILLDLHAEKQPQWIRLKPYFQQRPKIRVIWTMLHNFGGTVGMAGEVDEILSGISSSVAQGRVAGIGLSMEGIQQNEVLYDMVLAMAWSDFTSKESFISRWLLARYGVERTEFTQAWQIALDTVYNRKKKLSGWGNTKSIIEVRPHFNVHSSGFQPTMIGYDGFKFYACARLIVSGIQKLDLLGMKSDCLLYDGIDFVRQSVGDVSLVLLKVIRNAHQKSDFEHFRLFSEMFLRLVKSLGQLLLLHPRFDVKTIALPEPSNASYFLTHLRQAKILITQWSPFAAELHSYASRELGGMFGLYYDRWAFFFQKVNEQPQEGSREFLKSLAKSYTELENQWINEEQLPPKLGYRPKEILKGIVDLNEQVLGVYRSLKANENSKETLT